MKEFPIILETTSSEVFEECIMQSDVGDRDTSEIQPDDLSILLEDASMPIAVIGMGFRGPADATDTNRLWQMILEKREAWSPVPKARWNNNAFYHPEHARHGTINVEGGHFITEDLSLFDAPFFNMTSDEAAAMDPQQRLLLEVTYEGLENAGIPLSRVTGTQTSCFVGSFSADYTDLLLRDPECVPMYQCTNAGQSRAMMANRVSYFYDLKGPSVTVDTACSGSLVALHLACQSLRTGDASVAIAAGVNLILSHEFMSTMSMMRFLSPEGRCHTFDESANGYARGEAISCLILKPLAAALRDGDTIRAIIRGTGSNQDGRTPGITLPSGTAQEALIRDVYSRGGLCPSETEIVETHGTGTQAGDPVEVGAIARAFGLGQDPDRVLRIGSIKTNVGHLEGASGVAGVIKAIMMLENRILLPSRNFETPNPRIAFKEWNLRVPQIPEPWDTPGPHRVSVNSFGYGGSNAHVIVEDALGYLSERGLWRWLRGPSQTLRREEVVDRDLELTHPPRQRIFMISAFDEWSCKAQIAMIRDYLELQRDSAHDDFLDDLAFTLNEHRSSFMWKATAIGSSVTDLCRNLSNNLSIRCSARRPTLSFVFTGQGAQWAGMGKELLHSYPVFWESVSRIDKYLAELGAPFFVSGELDTRFFFSGICIVRYLTSERLSEELSRSPEDSQMNHPLLSQTTCTALQIALVDLLASWNIYPSSVTGHSSGEIAAAYACGALSVEDAMAVAYFRGIAASQLLISSAAKGAMIAIGMSAGSIQEYLSRLKTGKAVVACINSPSSVTVSGDVTAVEELTEILKDKSVFFRRLTVDVAYHSHHMELVAYDYLDSIQHISPISNDAPASHLGNVAMFSAVTGTEVQNSEMGAQYWVSNLSGQVKFSEALKRLCFETESQQNATGLISRRRGKRQGAAQKPSVDCLLEIGPHSALSSPIKQIIQEDAKLRATNITYLSMLSRKDDAVSSALRTASTLATMSYPLVFEAINFPRRNDVARKPQLLVDIPPYRWNHTRSYWAEPRMSKTFRNREDPRTDLLGAPDNMACPFERRWRNYLRCSEIPWLQDHRIQSDIIFPAAGYIAMTIEAIKQLLKDSDPIQGFTLQDVRIQAAMIVPDSAGLEVMTSLRDADKGLTDDPDRWYEFHVYSVTADNRWTEHCAGTISAQVNTALDAHEALFDLNEVATASTASDDTGHISVIDIPQLYRKLNDAGLQYGPCFSNLTCAHTTQHGVSFAEVTIPDTRSVMPMNFEHQSLIHPCTLDSVFHSIFAALPEHMGLETGPLIPISLETMKISCRIQGLVGEVLSICTHVRPDLKNSVVAGITATDNVRGGSGMEPKLSISGLRCARLGGSSSQTETKRNIPTAYGIEWQADPGFVFKEQAASLLQQECKVQSEPSGSPGEVEDYLAGLIRDEIVAFSSDNQDKSSPTNNRYQDDLHAILRLHNKDHQALQSSAPVSMREDGMGPSDSTQGLIRTVLHCLSLFPLKGVEKFRDAQRDTWDSYRNAIINNPAYCAAVTYLGLLGHKKPDMSVLEISDGGNLPYTLFLEKLAPRAGGHQSSLTRCTKYTFAYQEDHGLDQARAGCADWGDVVDFARFDLDRDVSQQELSQQSYDVIIAPNFFYSSHSVREGLLKIKSLLKSSGCLIIFNTLNPARSLLDALLLTTLYRWPSRAVGYFYRSEECGDILRETGFEAEEIMKDGLILSRPQYGADMSVKKILIIREDNNEMSAKFSENLMSCLPAESAVSHIAEAKPQGRICIVLSNLTRNLFQNPDTDLLQKIKEIFLQSEGVLWVTRGGTGHATNPDAALAVGFARTARSESGVQPILTLDLDPNSPILDDSRVRIIADLMVSHFFQEGPPELDTEYAERDGAILIPRVLAQDDLNHEITTITSSSSLFMHPFHQPEKFLILSRNEVGNEEVHFTASPRITELPEGQIGIRVFAFAISEFDTENSPNQGDCYGTTGFGCSGQVYKIGPNVDGFSVGDRVACLGTGTARNYYYDRASAFQKIDGNTSYEVAASLPLAYIMPYYIAYETARIKRGDTVLVHDAVTWYGQALVGICILNGADVYAVVFNEAQKDVFSKASHIEPRQVFMEGKDNIPRRLLESTHGKLPRVVITSGKFNSKMLSTLCKLTSPFGHIIQLRTQPQGHQLQNTSSGNFKNISFSTFDLFEFKPRNLVRLYDIWPNIMSLCNQGKLRRPMFYSAHRVTDISKAIRAVSSTSYAVVTAEQNEVVQVTAPNASKTLFRKDASYLLVGGLGGIGRAIASWMVEHGAKQLVLVNRSGLSTDTARSTVKMLREMGAEVAVRGCDISDEQAFSVMCKEISQTMPTIKGVIQAAMILKDVHIERMTVEDYNTVLRPKYAGTWSLHNHLPADLDFFVMLSSISGVIGNATQSAYAAGSAFMDSLAAYRNKLGLPAVSLDLGTVSDVGYLAENRELAEKMSKQGFQSTHSKTLLALVQLAISQAPTGSHSQIVTGLGEWKPGKSLAVFDAPLFSHFRRRFQLKDPHEEGHDDAETIRENLKSAKSRDEAMLAVFEALSGRIAAQLDITTDRINPECSLSELGIDSTDAVDLRNWISRTMESTVPILDILASGSVLQLVGHIASRSQLLSINDETS